MNKLRTPVEKELKYYLTKTQYEKLIKSSGPDQIRTIKQINYYFDDSLLRLRKRKLGLRIRLEDGQTGTLTLKEPVGKLHPKLRKLKIRYEWESPISIATARSIIKHKKSIASLNKKPIRILKKHFSDKELSGLKTLGTIKTTRTLISLSKGLTIEIDKYKMFDQKFYELEVESHHPEEADRSVRIFLKKHRIPYRPISQSKLGRFIECWKKRNR